MLAVRTEKSDCTNAIASLILFSNENSPKFANKRRRRMQEIVLHMSFFRQSQMSVRRQRSLPLHRVELA